MEARRARAELLAQGRKPNQKSKAKEDEANEGYVEHAKYSLVSARHNDNDVSSSVYIKICHSTTTALFITFRYIV